MSSNSWSSEVSPHRPRTRRVRRRGIRNSFLRRNNQKGSYIRLGHNQHPLPSGAASSNPKQQPSFRAIAYEDTVTANQPRRVTPAHLDPLPPTARGVQFPTRFKLCVHLNGRCYLGQHRSDPLYRIAIAWPNVVLYKGLATHDPLVGTLVHRSSYRKTRPNDEVFVPSGKVSIEKEGRSGLGRFTVDVPAPDGAGTRGESFEWRFTRGPAVRPLGRHSGLQLVRLATDVTGSGHVAPGGGEAVAVLGLSGGRLRRTAAFQFQGSGAQGLLGDGWEVVAVMTAIGLWDKHEKSYMYA